MKRKFARRTEAQKLDLINRVESLRSTMGIEEAAKEVGIWANQYYSWKRKVTNSTNEDLKLICGSATITGSAKDLAAILSRLSLMKYLLLLLFLFPSITRAEGEGKHFVATTVISSITCAAFKNKKHPYIGAIVGFGTAMFIGHIKESGDYVYDSNDMTANGLGAAFGAGLCLSF